MEQRQADSTVEKGAADVTMTDLPPSSNKNHRPPSKIRKGHEISSTTIKFPSWSYLHLAIISDPPNKAFQLDNLTVRSYLSSALMQFLGLTGSSISVDILKVEDRDCWIRVPRQDCSAVLMAVGGWIGGNEKDGQVAWKVKASGNWLGSLVGKSGVENMWSG